MSACVPTTTCASPLASAVRARLPPTALVSEHGPHAELLADPLQRQVVLLGERLGGRHQRALAARFDCAEDRVERDRRLAGADVALQEALHRERPREIAVDLGDGALLVRREGKRQRDAVATRQLARRAERRGHGVLVPRPEHGELEREQLVEREPPPGQLGLLLRLGEVERRERVAPQRELELRRERVEDVTRMRGERRAGELAQPRRRDRLARRIDGREVRGRACRADVVRLDVEAVLAEAAAQPEVRPRREPVGEPRLVEPGRGDRAGRIGDACRHDRQAPATTGAHVRDGAGDRNLLVPPELRDRHLVGSRFVPARPVEQHVADGLDPERTELSRQRRADAGERVHGCRQPLGSPPAAGAPPVRVTDHTRETRVHTGHRRQRDRL